MILEGHWLYACWSAFCIFIIYRSYPAIYALSPWHVHQCVLICIHTHWYMFSWLFDCHTLFPGVSSAPRMFFSPFLFKHFTHFPLSSATKTQNRRECGLVQNHRQMSLCWLQQLCNVSSEDVLLKLPLCPGFVWVLLSFHLVFRDKTYCDIS